MKIKQIAKRLRKRSDEFRRMGATLADGDVVSADRAFLLADVLLEVADQLAPPSKKKLKERVASDQSRKKIAIVKVVPVS